MISLILQHLFPQKTVNYVKTDEEKSANRQQIHHFDPDEKRKRRPLFSNGFDKSEIQISSKCCFGNRVISNAFFK
jgi:hypothetical protein